MRKTLLKFEKWLYDNKLSFEASTDKLDNNENNITNDQFIKISHLLREYMSWEKTQVVIVDPPSGWNYGFPKAYRLDNPPDDLHEWLITNGYPKEEIELLENSFYCRFMYDNNYYIDPKLPIK